MDPLHRPFRYLSSFLPSGSVSRIRVHSTFQHGRTMLIILLLLTGML